MARSRQCKGSVSQRKPTKGPRGSDKWLRKVENRKIRYDRPFFEAGEVEYFFSRTLRKEFQLWSATPTLWEPERVYRRSVAWSRD